MWWESGERGLALTLAESHIFVVAWEWVDRRGQRKWLFDYTTPVATPLDTVQDFLYKLHMKPHMHLVEISIFSPNQVIVRPTKIINNLLKDLTILIL